MTLKERAVKYANTVQFVMTPNTWECLEKGYRRGAKEQDPISRAKQIKIDIEKACDFLNRYLGKVVTKHNADVDVDFVYSKQAFIDLFKQAMEE